MSQEYGGPEIAQPYQPDECPQCTRKTKADKPFCECGFDLRHGKIEKNHRGTCIYCGAVGQLSKEHVFGKWLANKYDHTLKRKQQILRRPEKLAFWEPQVMHQGIVRGHGGPYHTVVYNNCEACNNGWMSNLHAEAQAIVSALADGNWPEFDNEKRRILARWCVMVAIDLEHLGRIPVTEQYQRDELKNGYVPQGWRISIGLMATANSAGRNHYRHGKVPIGDGNGDFIPLNSTYFCIERMAVHVFSSLGDRRLEIALIASGLTGNLITETIWPYHDPSILAQSGVLVWQDLDAIQKRLSGD